VARILASLALLATACASDLGMVPGVCGPIVLPLEVVNDGVDPGALDDAVAAWNTRAPIALFDVVPTTGETLGVVHVRVGILPDDIWGLATLFVAHREVLSCEVDISTDVAWHRPTAALVLAHELGHCLGLADDPSSYDLASVMGDPVRDGWTPTDSDIALVLDGGGCSDDESRDE
jgi:hypothetical protein